MVRWLFVLALAACRVNSLDLTGKQCPCPTGWYCATATNTCALGDAAPDTVLSDTPVVHSTYRQAVIADAPLAYWRLDDPGTTARDEMGSYDGGYSGTCTHGVAGALVGDSNTAVGFDGTSCKVSLPDVFGFPGTAPYSIEAWVSEPGAPTGFRGIFVKESRAIGPVDGYALVDSPTGAYFERAVNKSVPTTARVPLATGRYVHLVGVYDGTSFVMYVDGQAGAPFSDTRAMQVFSAIPLIGADLNGDFFLGNMDEVAVYGHALAADRIALHHQIGVTGP